MDQQDKLPLGVRVIIGFHIISIFFWLVGQGGSVIFYDTIASWGLVDSRASIDETMVATNRGIGLADALVGVPLFVLAIVGLLRRKFYGIMFSYMDFGIGFYWTSVAWAKKYFYLAAGLKNLPFDTGTHAMLAFVFLFSLWGTWYLMKNRERFPLRP